MSDEQNLSITKYLNDHLHEQMSFKINMGRKKYITLKGEIIKVFPNIFIISAIENDTVKNKSFSFVDIITGDVKITNK